MKNNKLAASIQEKLAQAQQQDQQGNQEPAVAGHGVVLLPRPEIYVDEQVRKTYTEASLKELADSISEMGKIKGDQYKGLLQAISVGPRDERGYPVTFGHRRFLAIDTFLKWDFVPSKIDESARESLSVLGAVQLVENIQREDLHPIEVALGIAQMREDGVKSGHIAKMLGKPQSYVSKHVKIASIPMDMLLELAKTCQDVEALYSVGQLVKLDDMAAKKLVQQAVTDGALSRADVASVIARVELAQRKEKLPSPAKIEQAIRDYYLNDAQEPLTLSMLRESMEVIDDDHELFIAVAAPLLSEITAAREQVNTSTSGNDDTPPKTPPETASDNVSGSGNGEGSQGPAKAPETTSDDVSGNGKGEGNQGPAKPPVTDPELVEEISGPVIKVRWLVEDVELHGRLLLSLAHGLGIKPADGMVLVKTTAGDTVTAPMDELIISEVVYA